MDSPKDNTTIFVRLGENRTVECWAISQGNIHFQLLRIVQNRSANGSDEIEVLKKPTKFVTDSAEHSNVVNRNKALFHFNNITKKDLGSYTCMAGNSVGFSTVSFILREVPKPIIRPTDRPGRFMLSYCIDFRHTCGDAEVKCIIIFI